jgi:hypothetical protein
MQSFSVAYKAFRFTHTFRASLCMSRSGRWRKFIVGRKEARALASKTKASNMEEKVDYSAWSHEKLIERVTQLEATLKNKNSRSNL